MLSSSTKTNKQFIKLPIIIGNALEWYDFGLYGYLSPSFINLFFPSLDPTASLIVAFSIFAVGFFSRPLGAIIFGHKEIDTGLS